MKNAIQAGLIGACSLACATAQAESSVTLYGVADAGFDFLSQVQTGTGTTASRWRAESSDWGASRFGLLGKEDVGGGLTTIFNLESGTNLMAGSAGSSGGRLFDRKAFVGLQSAQYGQFQMGRNLFIANDQWDLDPMLQEAYSSTALVRSRNVPITSNNIEYRSPSYGGFSMHAQYTLGNQSTGFNQMSNVFTSSREFFAGSNIYVNALTLQVAYTHLSAPDTPAGLARTADHYWLGAQYRVTPALALNGAVYHINVGSGAGDATHDPSGHATMFAAGTEYSLSKRSLLYATVAYVRNGSTSNFSVANNNPGLNNDNLSNPLPGRSQTGGYIGINHSF